MASKREQLIYDKFIVETDGDVAVANIAAFATTGYLVAAADTTSYIMAGIVVNIVDEDNGGPAATVRTSGTHRCYYDDTEDISIGDTVYMLTATTVQSATTATNDVVVGRVLHFYNALDDISPKNIVTYSNPIYVEIEINTHELRAT